MLPDSKSSCIYYYLCFRVGLTLFILFLCVSSYILMSEPDHIIVKPIPNLSRDGLGVAFPFFYIEPKTYESVLRKYFPEEKGPITKIDPIGNSPVIVGKVCNRKFSLCMCVCVFSQWLLLWGANFNQTLLESSQEDCSHLDECFLGNEEGSWNRQSFWLGSWNVCSP